MSFQNLPNELILEIAHGLSPPDTKALLRANRHMSVLLPPVLLENSICSPKHAQEALFSVAARGDKETVRKLLAKGILKSIRGHKPLLSRAVYSQSEACVRTLIACGVDLDPNDLDGLTPFADAVVSARLDIIKIFLDIPEVDVNSRCHYSLTPLHITLCTDKDSAHAEVLRVLLADERVKVDLVDESSWTPLSRAAHSGKAWAVRILLEDGRADVEHVDRLGRTPLHLAAKRGHDDIVRVLLESGGAGVNTVDDHGETPLFTAASRGYLCAVRELLADPRIDVNTSDSDDWSPLFVACLKGHVPIVKVLLGDSRTLVNYTDGYGFTPLQAASQKGYLNVVRELVRDPRVRANHQNLEGLTALHMAARAGYEEVVNALLGMKETDVDLKPPQGKSVRMSVRTYPEKVQHILQKYLAGVQVGVKVG
ncbi:unnamed protein product [Tuber aestivum]|uniref:Uncharacterized protein n=1 Tax=Tuber aestivum TaxID=59557 RepID=A0A292PP84_9PEZI|nr:unnamed protein product [Tuber aestivum]